ncbi:hypothetical protein PC9H_011674 [Pleurotus ostreatus]|uniref:N-acetyltransferase domain-containing protein n=1 Tax=Pleurotus ostreatus TaxID=5322 RepID=A0A8H7DPG6_PLEOS|nr:uncharacterized protein PC9H_011674 [Pleurotus ostreatus]KAF7421154.1 hypothetical protein PC9H_011674 [Pleurotus ostreatus]
MRFIPFHFTKLDDFLVNVVGPFQASPDYLLLTIIDKLKLEQGAEEKDCIAGVIGYLGMSTMRRSVELGPVIVLPEYQRTHVSTHAIGAAMRYILEVPAQGGLGWRRVQWTANTSNAASVRSAERMGMKVEAAAMRWSFCLQEEKEGIVVPAERGGGKGRHSTLLAVCWDDWENGVRDHLERNEAPKPHESHKPVGRGTPQPMLMGCRMMAASWAYPPYIVGVGMSPAGPSLMRQQPQQQQYASGPPRSAFILECRIWQKFTNTFSVASCLTRYAPIFRDYVKEFLLTSIADGISYVEPRINFRHRFMDDADGNDCVPHREWLVMFDEVLKEVKEDLQKQGREDEFIGAKIINTTLRFITPEELTRYTEDCIALKKEFPHLIAGFDLVGNENELKPLIDYLEPLLQFRERQKEKGVETPFLFHAGETFGDGTEADMNMYDAILLGTKRIGHGKASQINGNLPRTGNCFGSVSNIVRDLHCTPGELTNKTIPAMRFLLAFGLIVRRINDEPFDVPSVPGSRAVTIKFMIPNSRMGSVIGKQRAVD